MHGLKEWGVMAAPENTQRRDPNSRHGRGTQNTAKSSSQEGTGMKETLLHVPQDHPEKVERTQKAWGLNSLKQVVSRPTSGSGGQRRNRNHQKRVKRRVGCRVFLNCTQAFSKSQFSCDCSPVGVVSTRRATTAGERRLCNVT